MDAFANLMQGLLFLNLFFTLVVYADAHIEDEDVATGLPPPVVAPLLVFFNVIVGPVAGIASIVMDDLEAFDTDVDVDCVTVGRLSVTKTTPSSVVLRYLLGAPGARSHRGLFRASSLRPREPLCFEDLEKSGTDLFFLGFVPHWPC